MMLPTYRGLAPYLAMVALLVLLSTGCLGSLPGPSRPATADSLSPGAAGPQPPGPFEGLPFLEALDRAEEEWRKVLVQRPGDARALAGLAVVAHLRGEPQEALRLLDAAEGGGSASGLPRQLRPLLADAPGSRGSAVQPGTGATSPIVGVSVGPAVRVDSAGGGAQAAEPSILATSEAGGDRVTVAWIDSRLAEQGKPWRIALAGSRDDGSTWEDRVVEVPTLEGQFHADPMTAFDPKGHTAWVGGVAFTFDGSGRRGVWVASLGRGQGLGATEPEEVAVTFRGIADKSWLAAGSPPGDPEGLRLYLAFEQGIQISPDGGATWSEPAHIPAGGFIAPHPRVGPAGEVYVSYWDRGDGVMLLRSQDGGETFENPRRIATRLDTWESNEGSRAPGTFRIPPLPVLAVDPTSGTLYSAWIDTARTSGGDADLDLFLTRSEDGGETWSVPRTVLSAPGDQVFPWIEVDERGWLHLAFLDLQPRPAGAGDAAPEAWVDALYALSTDGGRTWTSQRLTASPYATGGTVWPDGTRGEQFLGDYLGLAVAGARVYVAYPAASPLGDLDLFVQPVDLDVPCPARTSLCLGEGRFRIDVDWETSAGDRGEGVPELLTRDTGFFWFFADDNVEVLLKVLDGCAVNGRYWVFAAGLTNVGVRIRVRDLTTGEEASYANPKGTAFQSILDTDALEGCE